MAIKLTTPADVFKFISFIEEALHCVDSWTPTQINGGGCGVFAKLLSEVLTANQINHKLYCMYMKPRKEEDDKESVSAEKNLLEVVHNNKQHLKQAGADHIITEIEGGIYVDSTGIVNPIIYGARNQVEITYDDLCLLIDQGKWNPTFDRDCIPDIKKRLQEMFDRYDTFTSGCLKYPGMKGVSYTTHTLKYLNPFSGIFG